MKTASFKTEVKQLLDLVINSMYSKKEIFLRELISNASDAIDRARFESLTHPEIIAQGEAFQITIVPNKEARTLVISDNGIGMDADEVEKNLGTIASSGTKSFLQSLKDAADKPELIGQFGVGFYAAFIVADRVEVDTMRAGAPSVCWASAGDGEYTVDEGARATRGTTITLHLREGMDEYLDDWRIEDIVKQYSDYIAYPIVLNPDPSWKPAEKKGEQGKDGDKAEETPPEPRTLNSMKAIWKRGKDEVTEAELNDFYKHISHDGKDPLASIQVSAEGATEFRALLFIPSVAPYDLFLMSEHRRGLQLYVRSVFIGDDIRELLPDYLRFVRGVVESSDLPLNVSREMLQDDAVIRRIRKTLVSRILGKLEDLAKNKAEDYEKFYEVFGAVVKEGLHSDYENADKLKELVRFPSTATEGSKRTSLKEYVARMPEKQKEIYFLGADSVEAARNSPMLEAVVARGYEVLFFVDPIDEWVQNALYDYDGKRLRPVDRGGLDLDGEVSKTESEQKKADETAAAERFKPLTDLLKDRLSDDVKEVRLSSRLTESACCLVSEEYGPNAHMERILKAMHQDHAPSKRILEINPGHPLMEKMLKMASDNPADEKLADYVELVHAQALLSEGSPIKNPARFSKLLSTLMTNA